MEKSDILQQQLPFETIDITDQLFELATGNHYLTLAAASMSTGYMLSSDYSLNTLSCDVEIDNPRTDFRFNRVFISLEEQITSKTVPPPQHLSNEQLVWMMDQMLIRDVAWLNGWPVTHCFYDLA